MHTLLVGQPDTSLVAKLQITGKERMPMKENFFVLGGDLRQLACAKSLSEQGYGVKVYGFYDIYLKDVEKSTNLTRDLLKADYLLLPLPVTTDGKTLNTPLWDGVVLLEEIDATITSDTVVFGGMLKPGLFAERKNLFDYAKQEDFLVKNAQITAEGALNLAISETSFSVYGSKVLITGYGRIGKILSRLCHAMGAKTYVAARKQSDLSWIQLSGCHPLRYDGLEDCLEEFDLVFNTVAAPVFGHRQLSRLRKDCLVIDLASVPGGIHWEAAKELGVRTIWALSLPGKVAPCSSGKIISETVVNLLNKE